MSTESTPICDVNALSGLDHQPSEEIVDAALAREMEVVMHALAKVCESCHPTAESDAMAAYRALVARHAK